VRSAIYIADGVTQVVLTPETETDKSVLDQIEKAGGELSIKRGSFYECRGGYVRFAGAGYIQSERDDSLMLVVRAPETAEPKP
jgi:hypothetical protein